MKLAVCAAVLGLCAASGMAEAASFNCNRARLPSEIAICGNEELGTLDQDMALLYYAAIDKNIGEDIVLIKRTQKKFLIQRDACGYDEGCIGEVYKRRIEELQSW